MKKLSALVIAALLALSMISALAVDLNVDDVLSNYAFALDGIDIQLPAPLSTLLDNGWSCSDMYADATLPAMSYDSLVLYKDSASVSATVVNATDGEKAMAECSLAGVLVFASDGVSLAMKNGIDMASDLDTVAAVYGLDKAALAAEYAEGSTGFSLSFYAEGDDGIHMDKGIMQSAVGMNQIDFNFDAPLSENGKLESVQLRYMDGAE